MYEKKDIFRLLKLAMNEKKISKDRIEDKKIMEKPTHDGNE